MATLHSFYMHTAVLEPPPGGEKCYLPLKNPITDLVIMLSLDKAEEGSTTHLIAQGQMAESLFPSPSVLILFASPCSLYQIHVEESFVRVCGAIGHPKSTCLCFSFSHSAPLPPQSSYMTFVRQMQLSSTTYKCFIPSFWSVDVRRGKSRRTQQVIVVVVVVVVVVCSHA